MMAADATASYDLVELPTGHHEGSHEAVHISAHRPAGGT